MQWGEQPHRQPGRSTGENKLPEGPADKSYITSSTVSNIQVCKGHFTLTLANINRQIPENLDQNFPKVIRVMMGGGTGRGDQGVQKNQAQH